MRWCGSAAVLLIVGAGAGVAQQESPPPEPPAFLAGRVAALVARQWGEDSAAVRLEWGALPAGATFPPDADVRLTGRGDGGWFGVVFTMSGAPAFAARVRAGIAESVTVAARPVPAGATLAAEDLTADVRTRWGARTDTTDGPRRPAEWIGWTTQRALVAGQPLSARVAAPPVAVRAGDPVTLAWRRSTVTVELAGTALASGRVGQRVRVRLADRGGERRGIVIGPGLVRLES